MTGNMYLESSTNPYANIIINLRLFDYKKVKNVAIIFVIDKEKLDCSSILLSGIKINAIITFLIGTWIFKL